ncbi:hypothetical protein BH10PLA2_BH10PLA2_28700 [soil metagenome]
MTHRRQHYLVAQEDLDRIESLLASLSCFIIALIEARKIPDKAEGTDACDELEAHLESLVAEGKAARQMEFPWTGSDLIDF